MNHFYRFKVKFFIQENSILFSLLFFYLKIAILFLYIKAAYKVYVIISLLHQTTFEKTGGQVCVSSQKKDTKKPSSISKTVFF